MKPKPAGSGNSAKGRWSMDKLFLAYVDGELVGVMTMGDAIKYAWNRGHASLYLEPENNTNKEA